MTKQPSPQVYFSQSGTEYGYILEARAITNEPRLFAGKHYGQTWQQVENIDKIVPDTVHPYQQVHKMAHVMNEYGAKAALFRVLSKIRNIPTRLLEPPIEFRLRRIKLSYEITAHFDPTYRPKPIS